MRAKIGQLTLENDFRNCSQKGEIVEYNQNQRRSQESKPPLWLAYP
jgi:hypothetical protein